MNPVEHRRAMAEELKAAQTLLDNAPGGLMTDEDQAKYDRHIAAADQHEANAKRGEELAKRRGAAAASTDENPTKLGVVTMHDRAEDKPWRSFGEHCLAIVNSFRPGRTPDPRLRALAATGASESVPSDGGILIAPQFAAGIRSRIYDSGAVASRCTRIGITSNQLKVNGVDESDRANGSRWGGVRAYWIGEADSLTESKPKYEQITLTLKKLVGLYYATSELLEDEAALGQFVEMAMTDELAFKLDDAIINGTGASLPLGILNSAALVSVAKETGQAAATVVHQNIVKMYSRMWPRSTANAVWFHNQNTLPQIWTMGLAVGTGGGPSFLPAGGLSGSQFNTLIGRPMVAIEQASGLGTQGDVIFADMTQYQLVDRGATRSDMSIHVKFTNDEVCFRWIMRVDGKPLWTAALTPYKGTGSTQSPFIVLDTRA